MIDPKSESSQNAGRVQGTVIRVIHPKHSPAPSPYRFLIKRALNQNAGKAGRECFLANSSHETNKDFPSPPATYQPYFVTKDDSGKEVWWSPETKTFESRKAEAGKAVTRDMRRQRPANGKMLVSSPTAPDPSKKREWTTNGSTKGLEHHRENGNLENEDQEAKGGLAQAGLSGVSHGQATGQIQVVRPRSIPASKSQAYCISNGTSIPVDADQNAEVAGHKLFLLRKTNCGIDSSCSSQNSPSRRPAPESHQNAGEPEKFVPPGMESRSPCSRSSKPMEVIVGPRKFFSPFRRLFSYLWSKSAFNDPSREMTCFGWRKKA